MGSGNSQFQLIQGWQMAQRKNQQLLTALNLNIKRCQALCTGKNNGAHSYKLRIPSSDIPLSTCHDELSKWKIMEIPKRVKIVGVIFQKGASGHSNRLVTYCCSMVRECNRAVLEDRK